MSSQRRRPPKKTERIVFRATDSLGTAAAENDGLLHKCFIDTGYLDRLLDTAAASPCMVIGRTGAGKSALLIEFERRNGAVRITPEELALSHISRSNIIGELAALGVKLDPFYKLLWRQFFCVHALSARFNSMTTLDRWFSKRHSRYRDAKNILVDWAGKDFFKNSSTISAELVRTLEAKIKTSLKAKGFSVDGALGDHVQQKEQIAPLCQEVITRDLAENLQAIMNVTKSVCEEASGPSYFVMDGLDEDWVQEDQRYLLIMGLIQTLSDMRGVPNFKVVAAIRRDLLEEVYRRARPAGFQEEKLQDMYMSLEYTRDDLERILDHRVNFLLRDRYSERVKLTHRDVFPDHIPLDGGKPRTIDYLLTRTQLRPRDLITFANHIIQRSKAGNVTVARIREAEKKYSVDRLKSVADEWHVQEPHLDQLARLLLRDQPSRFEVGMLPEVRLREKALRWAITDASPSNQLVTQLADGTLAFARFVEEAIQRLYRYGIVRLKPQPNEKFRSGLDDDAPEEIEDIGPDTRAEVHPMFWQALNIRIVTV